MQIILNVMILLLYEQYKHRFTPIFLFMDRQSTVRYRTVPYGMFSVVYRYEEYLPPGCVYVPYRNVPYVRSCID